MNERPAIRWRSIATFSASAICWRRPQINRRRFPHSPPSKSLNFSAQPFRVLHPHPLFGIIPLFPLSIHPSNSFGTCRWVPRTASPLHSNPTYVWNTMSAGIITFQLYMRYRDASGVICVKSAVRVRLVMLGIRWPVSTRTPGATFSPQQGNIRPVLHPYEL